jgi:hypothetical protein
MKEQQAFSKYGPGGRNCHCCGPSPKDRKKHDRTVKRRTKQYVTKLIKEELKQ